MDAPETFRCESFKLDMPVDKQRGFCAVQFRKGRDICIDCERGKEAAKETADEVRSSLPAGDARTNSWRKGITTSTEEIKMAEKKLCSKGDGHLAVKDDLCTKHYREKHGVTPFPKAAKGEKGQGSGVRGQGSGVRGQGSESSTGRQGDSGTRRRGNGAGVTDLAGSVQHESVKVLQTLVAIGAVTAAQVEATRKYVREMFSGE